MVMKEVIKKNAPKTYDVNYIVTFPNKDFIELTGTLKPYNTGRDYDYEFEVDYFAEEKEENYYDENSENIEKEILDKFYNKKENTNKMANGGGVGNNDRMYGFLKDDLIALESAIKDIPFSDEEIERFFSYWETHLKSLKTKMNDKMYNFLEDDLRKLKIAIKDGNSEEIERFFSYWETHLESLNKYAKGGKVGKMYLISFEDVNGYEIKRKITEEERKLLTPVINFTIIKEYAHGGSIEDENKEMVLNENNQIIHHTKELPTAIKGKRVPAWVVTKVHESASDLSDVTHYMDGQKMVMGGEIGNEINFEYEYAGKSKLKGTGEILSKNGDSYKVMVTKGLMKGKTTDIHESMIIGKNGKRWGCW